MFVGVGVFVGVFVGVEVVVGVCVGVGVVVTAGVDDGVAAGGVADGVGVGVTAPTSTIVTVLFACKYCISPSGLPELHTINADGTVRVIIFPVILAKTPLSATVPPKSVQDGMLIVVNEVQS